MSLTLSREPSSNPVHTRGTKIRQTIFTKSIQKKENIRKNLGTESTAAAITKIEKISKRDIFLFFVYTVLFMVVVTNQLQIGEGEIVYEAVAKIIINKVRIGNQYHQLYSGYGILDEITNSADFIDFIYPLFDSRYYSSGDSIIVDGQYVEDGFQFLKPFTSWRMVQKRVAKADSLNPILAHKRDPSEKESTETYGMNNAFTYSEEDGGFSLYFDVPLYGTNYTQGTDAYIEYLSKGYIDKFTKSIVLDAGFYSSSLDKACYVRITAEFSPTGYIEPYVETRCFPVAIYSTSTAVARSFFEIVLVLMTVYYTVIEVLKVINSIRNERLKIQLAKPKAQEGSRGPKYGRRDSGIGRNLTISLADQALQKGASNIKGIINGLLNHIQNLWSFLDVANMILVLICIIQWCQVVRKKTLKSQLSQLSIEPGQYNIQSETDLQNFHALNQILSGLMDTFDLYYRCCAICGFIILLKNLKYITSMFDSVKQIVGLVVSIVVRMIPFIILLFTILIAFSLVTFYFYGSTLNAFSSFEKSLFYTVQNILQNYQQLDNMRNVSYSFTLVYFVVFSFIIVFIMIKMFLIYVVAEFHKFSHQRQAQEKIQKKIQKSKRVIHIASRIRRFIHDKIYMQYLKIFKRKEYEKKLVQEEAFRYEFSRESMTDDKFNVNASIEETMSQSQNKIQAFSNDILREKFLKKTNKQFVQVFWTTIGIIGTLVIVTVISIQRHNVSEASAIRSGLATLISEVGVDKNNPEQTARNLDYLDTLNQLKTWINTTYSYLITYQDKSVLDEEGAWVDVKGFFLNELFYVVNQEVAITVRRKNPLIAQRDHDLALLSNISLPTEFLWNSGSAHPNEYTSDIIGVESTASYSYNTEKPGYFFVFDLLTYPLNITTLINDGIIDASINSIQFELALYHVQKSLPVYLQLALTVDSAGNVHNEINIVAIHTPTTVGRPPADEVIIYILEIFVSIATIIYSGRIIMTLKRKNEMYQHWYEIYIDHFPPILKRRRSEKKPEIIRRLGFIFTGEYTKIIFGIFLLIDFVLIAAVLATQVSLQKKFDEIIHSMQGTHTFPYQTNVLVDELQASDRLSWWLRLTDSLTLVIISVNLVYHYSYSTNFYIITGTLKKSFKDTLYMVGILTFIFTGFAYIQMLTLGTYDKDFSSVFTGFRQLLDSTTGISNFDIARIRSFKDLFVTIFSFYPVAIVGKLILVNLFIGIVYDSYIRTKKEASKIEREKISLSEFFKITFSLLCRRRKANVHATIEITDEISEIANPNRVMDQFRENLAQANSIKDIRVWSTLCSRDIMIEYETRKKIRRKAKEIASIHLGEEENSLTPNYYHNLDPKHRIKEYQVREVYWSYFRIGIMRLMKFYSVLNKRVQIAQRKIKQPLESKVKEDAMDRLKVYIRNLEEQIETNVGDLQEIRKVFRQHGIHDPDAKDEDDSI